MALQLRYLQTLLEMGVNQNTTIVFPLPLDLLAPFVARAAPDAAAERNGSPDVRAPR
jgi:hypothetical protein